MSHGKIFRTQLPKYFWLVLKGVKKTSEDQKKVFTLIICKKKLLVKLFPSEKKKILDQFLQNFYSPFWSCGHKLRNITLNYVNVCVDFRHL